MRYLICRPAGALGDCIIVTPLIRYLKQVGNEVYILTSLQGDEIYRNNPNLDKVRVHDKDSIPNEALRDFFESLKVAYECDKMIDLCESIEVNLSLYPADPRYNYTKQERFAMCNRNFYEETFRLAGCQGQLGSQPYLPEMFFTPQEEKQMQKFFKQFKDKFVILWGLSGSARNKTYPYVKEVIDKIPDAIFITVGDELCQILESPFIKNEQVIRKSGLWTFRESALACKYANLVISPDTGLLHASGCFDTPKIGLLTHTTRENITKHFKNDYSLEAEGVSCAPCFRIMYNCGCQCNLAEDFITPLCMFLGIIPDRIIDSIEKIKANV